MSTPSLYTPRDTTPMGAATSGTDRPYRKVIFDVKHEITLDAITVTLDIGCHEDEDYSATETYVIQHAEFEAWLEKEDYLDVDEDREVMTIDGPLLTAVEYHIHYVDWIREYIDDQVVISYMKAAKIIPDYLVDGDDE